jgi:hypothetical protein
MDQFHVISLLGADTRLVEPANDLAEATRDLNRKTMKQHARHAASWLLRAAFALSLFLVGRYAIQGSVGGALCWTAGFGSVYVLWYLFKGHLLIANDRQAKLYWLQNDAGNREHCSDGAIVATMPVQEPVETVRWAGNAAS